MISDGNRSLRSGDFVRVGDERTSLTSYARTFECAGLTIRFQCTDLNRAAKHPSVTDPVELYLHRVFGKNFTGLANFPLGRLIFGLVFFISLFDTKWPIVESEGFSIVFPLSPSPQVAAL